MISAGDAQLLRTANPFAEIHVAPGVGHLLPLEAPAWCNERIAAFAALVPEDAAAV